MLTDIDIESLVRATAVASLINNNSADSRRSSYQIRIQIGEREVVSGKEIVTSSSSLPLIIVLGRVNRISLFSFFIFELQRGIILETESAVICGKIYFVNYYLILAHTLYLI